MPSRCQKREALTNAPRRSAQRWRKLTAWGGGIIFNNASCLPLLLATPPVPRANVGRLEKAEAFVCMVLSSSPPYTKQVARLHNRRVAHSPVPVTQIGRRHMPSLPTTHAPVPLWPLCPCAPVPLSLPLTPSPDLFGRFARLALPAPKTPGQAKFFTLWPPTLPFLFPGSK